MSSNFFVVLDELVLENLHPSILLGCIGAPADSEVIFGFFLSWSSQAKRTIFIRDSWRIFFLFMVFFLVILLLFFLLKRFSQTLAIEYFREGNTGPTNTTFMDFFFGLFLDEAFGWFDLLFFYLFLNVKDIFISPFLWKRFAVNLLHFMKVILLAWFFFYRVWYYPDLIVKLFVFAVLTGIFWQA